MLFPKRQKHFFRNILWITIIEIFIKDKRRSGKQNGAVREKSLTINETWWLFSSSMKPVTFSEKRRGKRGEMAIRVEEMGRLKCLFLFCYIEVGCFLFTLRVCECVRDRERVAGWKYSWVLQKFYCFIFVLPLNAYMDGWMDGQTDKQILKLAE